MINVQPYLDELDKVKEWINLFVDRQLLIWLDLNGLPTLSPKEMLQLFNETGMIYSCTGIKLFTEPKFITFKEYRDGCF